MSDLPESNKRKRLRMWLEELPRATKAEREQARSWAVAIAHRASMRVLPRYWSWHLTETAQAPDMTALPILRLAMISGVGAINSAPEIKQASYGAAACAVDDALGAAAHAAAAVIAADAAANSAAASVFADTADAAADSAAASASLADDAAIWESIRRDCVALVEGEALDRRPLWGGDNPLANLWTETRPQILAQGNDWRFWVDWYENALHGRPQDYNLLTKIALIDPEDWDKSADHVNALIADIRIKHIFETRPLGEDAIDQGADGVWHRVGRSDIDRDILQDARDSVRDEIARIRGKLETSSGNMLTALIADLDLLDERIARHPDRPLRLHDTFLRVQANILYNLEHDELPDDVVVRDLDSVLGTAAMDMRNACPKTKSVVEARISARFDEADEGARADLARVADAAASRSDPELGHEFQADTQTAFDPGAPQDEKKAALYRLTTRLSLMLTRDAKNIVDAVVLLGGIGAGIKTFDYIVSLILRFVIF